MMIRRAGEWLRRRASVLIVLGVVLLLAGGALVAEGVQAQQAKDEARQVQAEFQRVRAQQARQGQVVELKLCTTLGRLASLKPPPGSAADNPSRAYLQDEHATLAQLGPDVGCPR